MSETLFYHIGCKYINHNTARSLYVGNRKFKAHFGVSARICRILWNRINPPHGILPKHLLWALLFLKSYNTEHMMSTILKHDEKTIRLHVWTVIDLLADLSVVCYFLLNQY
jgi:hypothetical protein